MQPLLQLAAVLCAGLFSGGALYIPVAEHPARMSLGAAAALQEFRASYKRAAPMQAAFAVICFLCSAALWWLTHRWGWIAGGSLVGAVVPFTLLIIMPTNRLLLNATSPPAENDAKPLLRKWARLHAVRTCLSLLGFLVLLAQATAR
ncbi:MAG: DUF1772 domain-containing protein [Candidatus Acidiferrales bacterium]